jgi:hypothetical protein
MGQTLAPTMAIWDVVFKVRFRSSGSCVLPPSS